MFPSYARHSYRGRKRYRRKPSTVGGMKLGVRLKVARRKSTGYVDRLGEWIQKAQNSKYVVLSSHKKKMKAAFKQAVKEVGSKRAVAKSTNGFHAKPGRKVQAKKFVVRGSFKKKHGERSETFTPSTSSSN